MKPELLTDEEIRGALDPLYAYGIGDDDFNMYLIEYRAIEAAVNAKWEALKQEPCGFMWQHEETGRVGFAEESQREKWKDGNPRLRIVGSIYTAPQPAQRTGDCKLCGHCAATGESIKPAQPYAHLKHAYRGLTIDPATGNVGVGTPQQESVEKVTLGANEALRVTAEGEFIWNSDADAMIENGDFGSNQAMRHILLALRKQPAQQDNDALTVAYMSGRYDGNKSKDEAIKLALEALQYIYTETTETEDSMIEAAIAKLLEVQKP